MLSISPSSNAPETGAATVLFYANPGLVTAAVQWDTQRPGQARSSVPSHCAIMLPTTAGPVVFEMIATGYHCRPATLDDLAYPWAVSVYLPDMGGALALARACAGARYSWAEIALIALYRLLPDRWLSRIHVRQAHICSVFVRDVLWAGGWLEPGWLEWQFCPVTPNDVLRALKPLKEVTHAGS